MNAEIAKNSTAEKKYRINTFISKETTSRALDTNALFNSSNLKGLTKSIDQVNA